MKRILIDMDGVLADVYSRYFELYAEETGLIEHFPFISWKQVVFCGNKSLIKADLMIDDHLKNLNNFDGETIMFIQPHSINKTDHHHKPVS
jgi:5'-nucleotidase